jgi:hypothetical protein
MQNRWKAYSLGIYLCIVAAIAMFQFFVNSTDWRHGGIKGTDGQAYYAFLRSAAIDHDLNFENEFYQYNYNHHGFDTPDFMPRSPITGLYFNRFPIGYSIFLIPFFLATHLLTILGNALHLWSLQPDGYTMLYQLAVVVNAIFWGACAYWTTLRILQRFFRPAIATAAALVFFLSYPGIFSLIEFWCNPYPQALLIFNLLLLLAFRVEDRKDGLWTWAGMGAAVGLMALLRTECAVLTLFPALLLIWRMRQDFSAKQNGFLKPNGVITCSILKGVTACFVSAVVFAPQVIVWRLMWGEWFHLSMNNSSEGFTWAHPVLIKTLFSTRHGLFYWSPIMLAGLAGLIWFARSLRTGIVLRLSLIQLLVIYYLYASWKIWWMGYSFGARQYIPFATLFCIGVGALMERFAPRRRLIVIASMAFILWNMIMLWLFLNGHIPSSEGFSPLLPITKFFELVLHKVGII